jgi:hypothetical protein
MSLSFENITNLFPRKANSWEILLWVVLAIILSGQFWLNFLGYGSISFKDIQQFYTSIIAGVITLLLPLIFWLVNGKLPLESIRNRSKGHESNTVYNISSGEAVYINQEKQTEDDIRAVISAINILQQNAAESTELATNLYRRSGLYLFIGTFIAVIGVLIFSFQGIKIAGEVISPHWL